MTLRVHYGDVHFQGISVSDPDSKQTDEFVRLLTTHQRRIYAYIRGLVWNAADANDVLQNTNEVLWTKRADFEPGTDFGSWAVRVAHYEVLSFRSRSKSDRHLFGEALLAKMADSIASATERVSDRQLYLEECLDELPDDHSKLLRDRYEPGAKVSDLAHEQGRSAAAISQQLLRIRNQVMDCIETKMTSDSP